MLFSFSLVQKKFANIWTESKLPQIVNTIWIWETTDISTFFIAWIKLKMQKSHCAVQKEVFVKPAALSILRHPDKFQSRV